MSEPLSTWTIYDHPSDYPGAYIARRFEIVAGQALATENAIVSPSLDAIRECLRERGLVCLARDPSDHPNVVETWI
jgi:hypothetical protein